MNHMTGHRQTGREKGGIEASRPFQTWPGASGEIPSPVSGYLQPDGSMPWKKQFTWTLLFLAVLLVGTFAFAYWLTHDSIQESVTGIGHLAPEGEIRTVASPMNGIAEEVLVQDNQVVQKGQPLLVLSSDGVDVDSQGIWEQIGFVQNQIANLERAANASGSEPFPSAGSDWIFAAKQAYHTQVQEASVAMEKAQHELEEQQAKKRQIEAYLAESEAMLGRYQKLYEQGGMSENQLKEYAQNVAQQRGELAVITAKLNASSAALSLSQKRPEELKGMYRKDILSQVSQYRQQLVQLTAQLKKASLTKKFQTLKAPVSGIINQQTIRGAGEIVRVGVPLFSIVPDKNHLVAKVRVSNKDLAYIHIGQRAQLHLEAFPFQQFGKLYGKVETLSPSTQQSETDKGTATYYLVTIRPEQQTMSNGTDSFPLRSGMTLTADMITHEKSLWDFMVEPVQSHLNQAFKDPTSR